MEPLVWSTSCLMSSTKEEFPKLRRVVKKGFTYYIVDSRRKDYPKGKMKWFKDPLLANSHIQEIKKELNTTDVSKIEQLQYLQAKELLRPYNKTVLDAVQGHIRWMENSVLYQDVPLVKTAVKEFLEFKNSGKFKELRPRTLDNLSNICNRFSKTYGDIKVGLIRRKHIVEYLDGLGEVTLRTKSNNRVAIGTFFNFCKNHKHYCRSNPAANISYSIPFKNPDILSIAECKKICETVERDHKDLIPYMSCCLFLGIRPTEVLRLERKNFNWKNQYIEIEFGKSKVKRSRFVKMNPTFLTWMEKHHEIHKIQCPNFRKKWDDVKKTCSYKIGKKSKNKKLWNPDVLRHTFASYHLAVNENMEQLSLMLGNTVNVLRKYYIRPILKETGDAFFKILPENK
jgi:integrase